MSKLFFWLTIYGKIDNLTIFFFGAFLVLSITSTIITIVLFVSAYDPYSSVEEEDGIKNGKKFIKISICFIILFILFSILLCIKPTKKEILTYYIIKQVDEYNIKNDNSNFNPENIIKNVDNTINKISDLADNLINKLNKEVTNE